LNRQPVQSSVPLPQLLLSKMTSMLDRMSPTEEQQRVLLWLRTWCAASGPLESGCDWKIIQESQIIFNTFQPAAQVKSGWVPRWQAIQLDATSSSGSEMCKVRCIVNNTTMRRRETVVNMRIRPEMASTAAPISPSAIKRCACTHMKINSWLMHECATQRSVTRSSMLLTHSSKASLKLSSPFEWDIRCSKRAA
jgi:hypothetical protein